MTADLSELEQHFNLPSGLLSAVQQVESGGDSNAVSPKGALGAFQFMPATAAQYGIDPTDPDQAAQGAAHMYSDLLTKYNGDLPSALAAYNWGQGNVDRQGLQNAPPETQNYIAKVTAGLTPQQQPTQTASNPGIMSSIGNFIVPSANAAEMPPNLSGNSGQDSSAATTPVDSFAHLSDQQLQDIADGKTDQSQPDFSHLSDQQLQDIADGKNQQNTGYINQVGKDLKNRFGEAVDAYGAYDKGQQGVAQTALQMFGKVVGGSAGDIMGDTASSLYHSLPDSVLNYVSEKAGGAADTGIAKGLSSLAQWGSQQYGDFKQANPNAARSVEAAADLANIAPLGEILGATGDVAKSAGGMLETAAANQVKQRADSFAQDLVMPKMTPSVAEDSVDRTTQSGIFGNKTVNPTQQEKDMGQVVASIPEVKSGNTIQQNYNAIKKAVGTEASSLQSNLESSGILFPRTQTKSMLDGVVQHLGDETLLTGDAQNMAEKVVTQMGKFVDANPSTPAGLLQARKDLDSWITTQKGSGVFDPVKENAISTAVRAVRQGTNNFIAQKIPTADVLGSLNKQSLMYRAMDNIAPKASAEAKNSIGRMAQKIGNAIPIKGDMGKLAAAVAGTGITGALGAAAPALMTGAALTGAGLYGATKIATSPITKNIIGKTLTTTGKVLKGGK